VLCSDLLTLPGTLMLGQHSADPMQQCLAIDAYLLAVVGVLLPTLLLRHLEWRECRLAATAQQVAQQAQQQAAAPVGQQGQSLAGPISQQGSAELPAGCPRRVILLEVWMVSCIAWHAILGMQAIVLAWHADS